MSQREPTSAPTPQGGKGEHRTQGVQAAPLLDGTVAPSQTAPTASSSTAPDLPQPSGHAATAAGGPSPSASTSATTVSGPGTIHATPSAPSGSSTTTPISTTSTPIAATGQQPSISATTPSLAQTLVQTLASVSASFPSPSSTQPSSVQGPLPTPGLSFYYPPTLDTILVQITSTDARAKPSITTLSHSLRGLPKESRDAILAGILPGGQDPLGTLDVGINTLGALWIL